MRIGLHKLEPSSEHRTAFIKLKNKIQFLTPGTFNLMRYTLVLAVM